VRLGISSYTFVWAVGVPGFTPPPNPLTALDLIDIAVGLGIGVVQIADNLPLHEMRDSALDELAQRANQHCVNIEVGTCGIQPQHLRTYLGLAVRLQSPILRVVIDTDSDQPASETIIATLRQLLPEFRQAGVCLAIENHDRFRAATLVQIIEQCGGEGIGICLDTANSLGAGEDIHTLLRVLGPWVVNVHLKDFRVARLPHKKGFTVEGAPAGQGTLDVPQLISEFQTLRRNLSVILELWPPPEPTIEQSIAKENAWTRQSITCLRKFIPD
jgi:sugar phosphate isomerase/epimerase